MQVLNIRLEESRAEKEQLLTENNLQSRQLQESAPKIKCYNDYISSDGTFTATQIAKEYELGAETLNKKLKEMSIQYKQNGQWLLTAKYDGKGYTKSVPRTYTDELKSKVEKPYDSYIPTASPTVFRWKFTNLYPLYRIKKLKALSPKGSLYLSRYDSNSGSCLIEINARSSLLPFVFLRSYSKRPHLGGSRESCDLQLP